MSTQASDRGYWPRLVLLACVAALVGCSAKQDEPVRFTYAELGAGSDILDVGVAKPRQWKAPDVQIIDPLAEDGYPDVLLFDVRMQAERVSPGHYRIEPEGYRGVASELWERAETLLPAPVPGLSAAVDLDRETPIELEVEHDRHGRIQEAFLRFGLRADKATVDAMAEGPIAASMPEEVVEEGRAFVDNLPIVVDSGSEPQYSIPVLLGTHPPVASQAQALLECGSEEIRCRYACWYEDRHKAGCGKKRVKTCHECEPEETCIAAPAEDSELSRVEACEQALADKYDLNCGYFR